MLQQHQPKISAQLETRLESVCAGPLHVADRLELRRLVDALCHASTVTDEPLPNTSRVDVAVAALKRFKVNLKRRTDARDGLTSKRLMDLPEDARAILLSSIAFIFRDEVDEWSQIDFGNETHVEMLHASIASSLAKLTNPQGRPVNEPLDVFFLGLRDLYQRRVEQFSHLLNDDSSQQEAVTIIRSLIDRIEITPGERRGDPQVQLVGGLAAILELAVSGQQKTAIQMDSGVGRVFMVAGAGFETATFRL